MIFGFIVISPIFILQIMNKKNLDKQVGIEVDAVFINKQLRKEIQIGKKGLFIGFMDKKSFKSTQLIFHVTEIKF